MVPVADASGRTERVATGRLRGVGRLGLPAVRLIAAVRLQKPAIPTGFSIPAHWYKSPETVAGLVATPPAGVG